MKGMSMGGGGGSFKPLKFKLKTSFGKIKTFKFSAFGKQSSGPKMKSPKMGGGSSGGSSGGMSGMAM